MDDREQFEKWCDLWDKQTEFNRDEPRTQQQPTISFYGMQSVVPEDEAPAEERLLDWREIYRRALRLDSNPNLLTEADEGLKPASGPGKGVDFTHNPVHFSSHGSDQSPSPYEPMRVTPNFSDGEELVQLNDLKVKLEKLESSLLAADIKAGGKDDYMGQLKSLRQKIDDLSNRLTPPPLKDLA